LESGTRKFLRHIGSQDALKIWVTVTSIGTREQVVLAVPVHLSARLARGVQVHHASTATRTPAAMQEPHVSAVLAVVLPVGMFLRRERATSVRVRRAPPATGVRAATQRHSAAIVLVLVQLTSSRAILEA